jgi:competence protein ComEC
MKLLNFNIIKLTLFLILGIIFSHINPISIKLSLLLLGICSIGLGVSYFLQKNKLKQHSAFGILALITFFLVGVSIYSLNDDKNYKHHYTNIKISGANTVFQVKICERLKPSSYHNKYIVELLRIDTTIVTGKLLLNISKDSLSKPFEVDAIFSGSMKIHALLKPLNPYQFDYKNYLNKKHIYGQLYVEEKDLILQEYTITSIYGYANSIRDFINNKLENYSFSKKNLAMINALLLGQKK